MEVKYIDLPFLYRAGNFQPQEALYHEALQYTVIKDILSRQTLYTD